MMFGFSLGFSLGRAAIGGTADPDEILQENDDNLLLESGLPIVLNAGIPAQAAAAALTGSEYVAIVQGGTTKHVRADILALYLQSA